jgi:hypothetical protein
MLAQVLPFRNASVGIAQDLNRDSACRGPISPKSARREVRLSMERPSTKSPDFGEVGPHFKAACV